MSLHAARRLPRAFLECVATLLPFGSRYSLTAERRRAYEKGNAVGENDNDPIGTMR